MPGTAIARTFQKVTIDKRVSKIPFYLFLYNYQKKRETKRHELRLSNKNPTCRWKRHSYSKHIVKLFNTDDRKGACVLLHIFLNIFFKSVLRFRSEVNFCLVNEQIRKEQYYWTFYNFLPLLILNIFDSQNQKCEHILFFQQVIKIYKLYKHNISIRRLNA